MAPRLYTTFPKPPIRAVLMVAKAIGVDLEMRIVNVLRGEHFSPEYHKINPQHTLPTLEDEDGFIVWDSRAIITYLVSKYAKDDSLYPNELKKRAVIDQRLHFEGGIVTPRIEKIFGPLLRQDKHTIDQEDKDGIYEVYGFLEIFLEDHEWMAGDSVTVADYSLIPSISTLNPFIPVDPEMYPRLTAWMRKAEDLPAYEENKNGLEMTINVIGMILSRKTS